MTSEDIRTRERARDITAIRLAAQQRILSMRGVQLAHAQNKAKVSLATFEATRHLVHRGRVDLRLMPLLAKNLERCEGELAHSSSIVSTCKQAVENESVAFARLEALYAQLNDEVLTASRGADQREFEAQLDDRTSIIAGLSSSSMIPNIEPGSLQQQAPQYGPDQNRSLNGQHQSQSSMTENPNSSSVPSKNLRDVQAVCADQDMKLSRVDTWQRLDESGMRLELKLSGGEPVTMAISKAGGDHLLVRISRSAAPVTRLHALRAEVLRELKLKGLNVKDVLFVEEI